jgi:hypothetical protein
MFDMGAQLGDDLVADILRMLPAAPVNCGKAVIVSIFSLLAVGKLLLPTLEISRLKNCFIGGNQGFRRECRQDQQLFPCISPVNRGKWGDLTRLSTTFRHNASTTVLCPAGHVFGPHCKGADLGLPVAAIRAVTWAESRPEE